MRLTGDEARARFAGARSASLAMADLQGRPMVVVVTFAVSDDVVVTAVDSKPKTTRHLRRLDVIAANPQVSVLADLYDDADWSRLWWVRGDGSASILTSPQECAGPRAMLVEKYPQYAANPPEGPVIRIEISRWSGWAYAG